MNKTTEKEFLFCEYCTRTNPVSHFMIVPTIEVFRMSLYKWGGFSNNKVFVGLDNFKILWNDMNFFRSLQNSIVLIVIVTLITMVLAILFATLLTREKIKGKSLFRIIFYIPNILSVVVISGYFRQFMIQPQVC